MARPSWRLALVKEYSKNRCTRPRSMLAIQPSSPAKAGDAVIAIGHMGRERNYWVYIVASGLGGTLYIGVTNDLIRRIYEHKNKVAEGFTRKYDVDRLVYFRGLR